MKLNKKGFTLIELLAVIVILLAISTIAISSISSAIERNKQKTNNAKKEVLASYGELYLNEEVNNENGTLCIKISDLKSYFNLEDSEVTDADNKQFGGVIDCTESTFNEESFTINAKCKYINNPGDCK